jgi:hypothetical protein
MRNYVVMGVEYPLYELLSDELMRGFKITPNERTLQSQEHT